jgi:signal transduction histidine kinase
VLAWLRNCPVVADALLAGLLLTIGLISVFVVPQYPLEGAEFVVVPLLTAALFVSLAWRRRYPRVVGAVVAIATIVIWWMDELDGTTAVAGSIVVYGLGRYVGRPQSLQAYTVSSVTLVLAALVAVDFSVTADWFRLVSRCSIVLGPFWLGDSQRARIALTASHKDRADRAEAERAADARRAVVDERGRIARELHDVVAHSVSVMVVQATAAERLATVDVDRACEAIASVAQVGRSALTEMRRILDVLDAGEPDASDRLPQPALADLGALIDRCRSAGLDVTVEHDGTSPALSAGTELSIYRVIQEALTNVLKHAGRAHATVRLSFGDPIVVEIADDGRGAAAVTTSDGRGRGLIGMRERISALHGTFAAGPRPGGGYLVRATLPMRMEAVKP